MYLNPQKYSSSEGYGASSFANLSKDVSFSVAKCGYNIVRNSTRPWKANGIQMVRFVCTRYRKFRGSTRCVDNSDYNFRNHDFHNDKKIVVGKKVCIHNKRHGLNGQLHFNFPFRHVTARILLNFGMC